MGKWTPVNTVGLFGFTAVVVAPLVFGLLQITMPAKPAPRDDLGFSVFLPLTYYALAGVVAGGVAGSAMAKLFARRIPDAAGVLLCIAWMSVVGAAYLYVSGAIGSSVDAANERIRVVKEQDAGRKEEPSQPAPPAAAAVEDANAVRSPEPEQELGSDPAHPAPRGKGLAGLGFDGANDFKHGDEVAALAGPLIYPGSYLFAVSPKYVEGAVIPWPGIAYMAPSMKESDLIDWYEAHVRGGYLRGDTYCAAAVRPGDRAKIVVLVMPGPRDIGNPDTMVISLIDATFASDIFSQYGFTEQDRVASP